MGHSHSQRWRWSFLCLRVCVCWDQGALTIWQRSSPVLGRRHFAASFRIFFASGDGHCHGRQLRCRRRRRRCGMWWGCTSESDCLVVWGRSTVCTWYGTNAQQVMSPNAREKRNMQPSLFRRSCPTQKGYLRYHIFRRDHEQQNYRLIRRGDTTNPWEE